jgi:hypothetical protein
MNNFITKTGLAIAMGMVAFVTLAGVSHGAVEQPCI